MGSPQSPNIIMILFDTARAKSFSIYGNNKKTTPFLDDFSKECIVYKRCYAPSPWTSPSHASLFTGLYPSQHGVYDYFNLKLIKNIHTLPDILSSVGYKTLGISCNALISKNSGFGRGFDYFKNMAMPYDDEEVERLRAMLDVPWYKQIKVALKDLLNNKRLISAIKAKINSYNMNRVIERSSFTTNKTLRDAVSIIRNSKNPFFLFINLMETHTIYNPPTEYRNRFIMDNPTKERKLHLAQRYEMAYYSKRIDINIEDFEYLKGLYEESLLYLDNFTECVVNELKKRKIFNEALLIITSDHGEHIGEKGHFTHVFSLYDEVLHVPLIIKYPGSFLKGTNGNIVQLNDVFATIIDLVGIDYPAPETSISLNSKEVREAAFAQYYLSRDYFFKSLKHQKPDYNLAFFPYNYSMTSIIYNQYKLIKKFKPDRIVEYELYKISNDFCEHLLREVDIPKDLITKLDNFEITTNWRKLFEYS